MKVKVITKFKDKYSKKWHNVNDIFNVSAERFEEIKKFVINLPEEHTSKGKKKTKGDSQK